MMWKMQCTYVRRSKSWKRVSGIAYAVIILHVLTHEPVSMSPDRKHDEEFHERVKTDEEAKAKAMKKKTRQRSDSLPKRSFESTRQKPTRIGRVHQPR